MAIATVLLLCAIVRRRGLVGLLAGGAVGSLAATGIVTAAAQGELADVYTPVALASDIVVVAAIAVVLAHLAPFTVSTAALAWSIGSVAAIVAAVRTGQTSYVAPLALGAVISAAIARLALRHTTQSTAVENSRHQPS